MQNESNNPSSLEVKQRLTPLYARLQLIDSLLPDTAPNIEMARATCYKTRSEVRTHVSEYHSSTGKASRSYFEPNLLRPPIPMGRFGALSSRTDPSVLLEGFSRQCVSCRVGSTYPPKGSLGSESSFYFIGVKQTDEEHFG